MLRCYLMGQESLLIQCAEILLEKGHTLCGVITETDQIVAWATGKSIPVLEPGKGLADRVSEPHDYFFSIANLRVVEPEVFGKASKGAINFHDGPLPRYAGLYATAWALISGEESHGITWHAMTEDVDAGDIYKQRLFDLREGETSFTLNTHCYQLAIETFAELVDELDSGAAEPQAQKRDGEAHYFALAKRPPAVARLNWSEPAAELEALVRGLDFGPVENPLALPKLLAGGHLAMIGKAEAVEGQGAPGTVIAIEDDSLTVAAGDGHLVIRELRCDRGNPLVPSGWLAERGVKVGDVLPSLDDDSIARLTEIHEGMSRHEPFWLRRLETFTAPSIPYARRDSPSGKASEKAALTIPEGAALDGDGLVAGVCAYLSRIADAETAMVSFRDGRLADLLEGTEEAGPLFATHVPLRIEPDRDAGLAAFAGAMGTELARVRKRKGYVRDAVLRHPSLAARVSSLEVESRRVVVELVEDPDSYTAPAGSELAVAIQRDGRGAAWWFDPAVYRAEDIATMQGQLGTFLAAAQADRDLPLARLPLLPDDERKRLLVDLNATAADYPRDACIHTLFEARAAERPDAPALAYLDEELSYAELDGRANRLARHLRTLGVGRDVLVGVCVERSTEMLVTALAVMKAGGAYVPMDPSYPKERLALMIEDSKVPVLVTQRRLVPHLPERTDGAKTVLVDADWPTIAEADASDLEPLAAPDSLAYCIYTSGSTGRPKGVMVEHRNAVNFFTGMDDKIGHGPGDEPGVWLALTSLSFDISVLELFWTLARGFKIVLHTDKADEAAFALSQQKHGDKTISFSLMYFASDEGENASSADKYKLLIEGAKFGDNNGFEAVWTPERHFHAFGGLYPNPSVASAAIATITTQIHIRAASVVSPLHHPIRIAEEWSLVDNLSQGRVGISFASGWQPNDFIIYKPERFKDRKEAMLEDIQTVRALWRGETFKATSPFGKEIEVTTLPRPVQKELPFWLTAAGNPETFRAAGESGANLLTHLLGQSREELKEKIGIYRKARKDAGHEGPGRVTLMLHTFIGPDEVEVKDTVREPMKQYLKSSLNLIKLAAWSFPTFKQQADATGKTPEQIFEEKELSDEEMDALLEHSFERYYQTSGLFGTPARCLEFVDSLKGIDIDEIGCLLDYGVPSAKVLAHLSYLNELKQLAGSVASEQKDHSLAAQVARHGVTHLQCTPSQMTMILAGDDSRAAIAKVGTIMVGGEAFPASVGKDLRAAAPEATILNMYGPTETTIWSAVHPVSGREESIPIGRPIANTQIYILDRHQQPLPSGVAGELWIGGDGVVRGYYERPELTAERFLADPFRDAEGARMYRTGDLARFGDDGILEFLGRVDFQVKIRGYRIELGEIEAFLAAADGVREAVVVAREDTPGDKRLVAYLVADADFDTDGLRAAITDQLPSYMVPQAFVVLDRFPLTPNRKVDRKALPAPEQAEVKSKAEYVQPDGELEESIATVWREVLNVKKVGMDDNFFDLGGHSLLTVQVHRVLKDKLQAELALTDLFRFPTIRTLVAFMQSDGAGGGTEQGKDRAAARKDAMARRQKLRDRRRQRR